jgi:hypothetical protein
MITQYLKNIPGWRSNLKLVVLSVDDYGNLRLGSPQARIEMNKAGLKVNKIFDQYDTLETSEDLLMLYDVLRSVKDCEGKPAVFTPFAVTSNINFDKILLNNNTEYVYENLPVTFEKMSNVFPEEYSDTWKIWQQGISDGLMKPQFHGREHLNIKFLEELLEISDFEVITSLKNMSYTSISKELYKTIKYTAAFDFWRFEENEKFREIIKDGLSIFKEIFGYEAVHFNPPGAREHNVIHEYLYENGIRVCDTPMFKNEHQGNGKYVKSFFYTGMKKGTGMSFFVRNVVFEPVINKKFDSIGHSMNQIEAAFNLKKPAIISSHRVNFSGFVNKENREYGLNNLKVLLNSIVKKWPDVNFVSSQQLYELMRK